MPHKTLHQLQEAKRAANGESTRKARQAMYNTSAWRKASGRFKRDNPLCIECNRQGKISATWATDHVIPHGGNERLFWDESNWQPLCVQCHAKKSRAEGGW